MERKKRGSKQKGPSDVVWHPPSGGSEVYDRKALPPMPPLPDFSDLGAPYLQTADEASEARPDAGEALGSEKREAAEKRRKTRKERIAENKRKRGERIGRNLEEWGERNAPLDTDKDEAKPAKPETAQIGDREVPIKIEREQPQPRRKRKKKRSFGLRLRTSEDEDRDGGLSFGVFRRKDGSNVMGGLTKQQGDDRAGKGGGQETDPVTAILKLLLSIEDKLDKLLDDGMKME